MCMLHNHSNEDAHDGNSSVHSATRWYKTPTGLVCLALAVAAGYYLWVYHSQHVLAFLPFLVFLACPLMHILMHGRHGHHDAIDSGSNKAKRES
jgi:hypothetical protein